VYRAWCLDLINLEKIPKSGFFIIIVYFTDYKDNTANDTRKSLKSLTKNIGKNNEGEIEHHLFALTKSIEKSYFYSILALAEKIKKSEDINTIEHQLSAVIKKPYDMKNKRSSRAIGALEILHYQCDNNDDVYQIYNNIRQWCEKRNWKFDIMYANWLA